MNFLEKLDALMSASGINKSRLSQLSGVPYTTIDGFYKKGYENAKISTIRKIAHTLDTSLDYLIEETPKEPEDGAACAGRLHGNSHPRYAPYGPIDDICHPRCGGRTHDGPALAGEPVRVAERASEHKRLHRVRSRMGQVWHGASGDHDRMSFLPLSLTLKRDGEVVRKSPPEVLPNPAAAKRNIPLALSALLPADVHSVFRRSRFRV